MEYALIIGGTPASVDTLEDKLWGAGYRSIIAVRDTVEAALVVQSCLPNLIVFVPASGRVGSTGRLRELSEYSGAPIIVATADPTAALRCLGPTATLEGPYSTNAFGQAEAAARAPEQRFATAA